MALGWVGFGPSWLSVWLAFAEFPLGLGLALDWVGYMQAGMAFSVIGFSLGCFFLVGLWAELTFCQVGFFARLAMSRVGFGLDWL